MSRSAHDLDPGYHGADHPFRDFRRLAEDAVDAEADPHFAFVGLEVDVGCALGDRLAEDAVDELDHRRVLGIDLHVADLCQRLVFFGSGFVLLGDRLADGALERVEPADQRLDVFTGGDGDVAVVPGPHFDVVEREQVGRIRRGDQERALVDERDRQRAVASRRADRDQVRRRHVNLEQREIDVIEPIALGDGLRELLGGDRTLLEQQVLRRVPRRAGLVDRLLDPLLGGGPELDENVGHEPGRAGARDRRRQPGRRARHEGHRLRVGVTRRRRLGRRTARRRDLLVRFGGVLDRTRSLLDLGRGLLDRAGRILVPSVRAPARSSLLNRGPAGGGRGDPGLPCSPYGW